jgi:histidinol-phosphate phosphatase family protein
MTDFLKLVDSTWTLFLDRDGVINRRIVGGYVAHPDEFEFLPGVLSAIKFFNKKFGRVCVVTNQQGVGKGLMDVVQLELVHQYLVEKVSEVGGWIDGIYFCTDLASKPDNCRKPNINMAIQAKNDFPEIDFSRCIMVGDSTSDMAFGRNAGMKTIFISTEPFPDTVLCDTFMRGLDELEKDLLNT